MRPLTRWLLTIDDVCRRYAADQDKIEAWRRRLDPVFPRELNVMIGEDVIAAYHLLQLVLWELRMIRRAGARADPRRGVVGTVEEQRGSPGQRAKP